MAPTEAHLIAPICGGCQREIDRGPSGWYHVDDKPSLHALSTPLPNEPDLSKATTAAPMSVPSDHSAIDNRRLGS